MLDEKKAAQDEILRLTLVASADAAGMDAVAFKAQQEGISLLEAEKAIEEENKSRPATTEGAIITVEEEFEASIQEAKRRVELEKQQRLDAIEAKGKDEAAREAWLSKREDAVTSPRTKARRKLLRLLYKATRRQNQGYVICEWGCGQWC